MVCKQYNFRAQMNKKMHWLVAINEQQGTDLCPAAFPVCYKPLTSTAEGHIVTCHPLVRIMTSLSGNPSNVRVSSKVHLKPLSVVSMAWAPGPSVSSSTTLMQSCVSGRTIEVIWRRGPEHGVRYTAIFQTKWNVTFTWKKCIPQRLPYETRLYHQRCTVGPMLGNFFV